MPSVLSVSNNKEEKAQGEKKTGYICFLKESDIRFVILNTRLDFLVIEIDYVPKLTSKLLCSEFEILYKLCKRC